MGEHVWTRMTIGGGASQSTLDALATIAEQVFPNGDTHQSVRELIASSLANGVSLHVEDNVNCGRTDTLGAFCREHGLSYQAAWAAATGQFEAGLVYWHPGISVPVEESALEAGEPVATLRDLRRQLRFGFSLIDVVTHLEKADASAVPPLKLVEPSAQPRH